MMISARVEDKLVIRAYTPISSDSDLGYFDLVVKIYRAAPPPTGEDGEVRVHHSQGGKMSQYLGSFLISNFISRLFALC